MSIDVDIESVMATRRMMHSMSFGTSDRRDPAAVGSTRERRLLTDRRGRPTPPISTHTFRGRRRGARRREETVGLYVDRLAPAVAWLILFIFIFQCLDTYLTLVHLLRGGKELNPLMAYLIDVAPGLFIATKLGFSLVGLLFLGIHQHFPFVRKGIVALFVAFLGVVLYHLFIISWAVLA
jgi:hypothetical protein